MADHSHDFFARKGREASQTHGVVDGLLEVVDGVEQRAVEVEDDEFGFHKIALYAANVRLFHP